MQLKQLEVNDFRCIARAVLDPAPGINVFVGANGSGKTSVLEAIYVLGSGRSFRTRNHEEVIKDGRSGYLLRARVQEVSGRLAAVAMRRAEGIASIKYDGVNVRSAAILASKLRMTLITPDTHIELQSSPKARRRWLDQTLFHVKPNFLGLWKRFMRGLQNRNGLLRRKRGGAELDAWDIELAALAAELHRLRVEIFHALLDTAIPLLEGMFGKGISLNYLQGWAGDDYLAYLSRHRATDLALGSTRAGPHRADINFRINGFSIGSRLSRGQFKLWASAMMLAQSMLIARATRQCPLLLVDDLMSDLDAAARDVLMHELDAANCQLFLTTTDFNSIPRPRHSSTALFHVKHGALRQAA